MPGNHKKTIAFVIYPGMSPLDIVGPMYMLGGAAGYGREFAVLSVGARREPAVSDTPLQLIPEKTFEEAPEPYGLIVPGGGPQTFPAMADPALRDYLRSAAQKAGVIGAVGTGSLILAAAGLLQGVEATTHWAFARVLESYGVRYVRRRWIEDGRFIFSQGVSSGIDAALALVARMTDEATARQVQLSLEYDPQPPLGGIDYAHKDSLIPLPVRLVIGTMSLAAPLLTAGPRRMTRKAGWKPLV